MRAVDMDARLATPNTVVCPFCGGTERAVYRREPKADHRVLHYCRCLGCGQHYQFGEDKAGKASVRKR
jgi:hypothetical protein